MPEIIQAPLLRNPCYRAAVPCRPSGILVHATGAVNSYLRRYVDAPARLGENRYNNTWNRPDAKTCVHAFIGRDKNGKVIVAETLPHAIACRGCGGGARGSYNRDPTAHIQFEICQGANSDAAYYREAIGTAQAYCAHLCTLYGWGADRITSHCEAHAAGYASNHADPADWMRRFGDGMDAFRARVAALLQTKEGTTDMTVLYQAVVDSKYPEGVGLWDTSAKGARIARVAKGETVDVLSAPDDKGFCRCRYQGKIGWADGRYLTRAADAPPVSAVNGVLEHLYAARTALNSAIRASGGV